VYTKPKRCKKGVSNMARKTKEMSPDQKRQVVRLHQDGFRKTEIGKIIGFSRSAVSKFLKRFDQRENIENKL
jgi:DNA invertase Pin-like site-specific DNA recombinase